MKLTQKTLRKMIKEAMLDLSEGDGITTPLDDTPVPTGVRDSGAKAPPSVEYLHQELLAIKDELIRVTRALKSKGVL